MKRALCVVLVLVGLGVAYAEEKVQKDQGSARARFSWEKFDGDLASELNRLSRTIEGTGVGGAEIDSGSKSAVWIDYDPEKTTAAAILARLKDTRVFETAKLSSIVAMFRGPFGTVTAVANAKGAKGAAKKHGELVIQVEAAPGHALEMDAKPGAKSHGRFKPGVVLKAPHEIDLDKGYGKVGHAGGAETYVHGITVKKGGDDAVIGITVNIVDTEGKKESLHAVELSVPVQAP